MLKLAETLVALSKGGVSRYESLPTGQTHSKNTMNKSATHDRLISTNLDLWDLYKGSLEMLGCSHVKVGGKVGHVGGSTA